jgi:cytochrome P450
MHMQYETARLYGPVVMMPRITGDAGQRLVVADKEYILPPNTAVTLNFAALHTHPDYWGADALKFRPSRWIVPGQDKTGDSSLFQPSPGSFVPWNAGPRVCKAAFSLRLLKEGAKVFRPRSRQEILPGGVRQGDFLSLRQRLARGTGQRTR